MSKNILAIVLWMSIFVQANAQSQAPVLLNEGLVVTLGWGEDDRLLSPNVIVAKLETGTWKPPAVNDKVKNSNDSTLTWQKITADSTGWFKSEALLGSYVYFEYISDKEDVALLEAGGHRTVYVNGVAHAGNPYRYKDNYEDWEPRFDYYYIPIKLKKGKNELVFECNRGLLKAIIHPGQEGFSISVNDKTVPDLIVGEKADYLGAVPIINATEKFYDNLIVKAQVEGGQKTQINVPEIVPLSIYKAMFKIKAPAPKEEGTADVHLEIATENGEVLTDTSISLRVVQPGEKHRETFISKMDESVQYYAVNPPESLQGQPALFLSLHGAGVEALNQAQAYSHKNWGFVVAATNRRPYGYNWENWGRLDGLEVLDIAKKKFNIDQDRIYLTGHSMGGHGTWQLGVNYADQFAAIGPSAGWISIWSYRIGGLPKLTPLQEMLVRSNKQSDTYAFATNLKSTGIYILHGAKDDNVPPEQSYLMIDTLENFHKDFVYHEEPEVGHWWDKSDEPGADCVDWIPMFDFFAHHRVSQDNEIKNINFVTSNLAVSYKHYWFSIIQQDKQQKLSKSDITLEFGNRKFVGTTENINMLCIDANMLPAGDTVNITLDEQEIKGIVLAGDQKIYLEKANGRWDKSTITDKAQKNPNRCGNVREALNHDVVFVYGTHGSAEENQWALEKARYDAERIWYRGNGAIELIADDDYNVNANKDQNVILFGNRKTNSVWKKLLNGSPIQVDRGKLKVGKKSYEGNDLTCLFVRPRKGSDIASVGVVSGTGLTGMKLTNLAEYYNQYVGLPDVIIYNSDILQSDDKGVKFTGYFGNDWSLENGEFIKR